MQLCLQVVSNAAGLCNAAGHSSVQPLPAQGLPEGHTRPCWPIQTPGVGAHRARPPRTEADAEAAASKRWDLLGECSCSAG